MKTKRIRNESGDTRRAWLLALACLAAGTMAFDSAQATPWRFGIISDSQRGDDDNPGSNGVSVPMLNAIAADMKTRGIDLVIAPGDITEAVPVDTTRDNQRAQYQTWKQSMSPFYNAGIGVYPVRGNHEGLAYGYDAVSAWKNEFGYLPQNGPSGDAGQTYSFQNKNAQFIAIDMYDTKNVLGVGVGSKESSLPQSWIDQQINASSAEHLFVYAHEPMYGRNHDDGYTGSTRSNFLNSIANGSGGMYISGHDHQHSRSAITNGSNQILVQQLVCAPAGEKYYGYDAPTDPNDHELTHQGNVSGYYIVEVDGPKVTFEFYAAAAHVYGPFSVADRWSYYNNGPQYWVAKGTGYGGLSATITGGLGYVGSTGRLLAGSNQDKGEAVSMGWQTRDACGAFVGGHGSSPIVSDLLDLSGMERSVSDASTETYALEISFSQALLTESFSESMIRMVRWDAASGQWALAGLESQFVLGSYLSGYGLGTYGLDIANHKVWAVVDQQGLFAAAVAVVPEPASLLLMAFGAAMCLGRPRFHFR